MHLLMQYVVIFWLYFYLFIGSTLFNKLFFYKSYFSLTPLLAIICNSCTLPVHCHLLDFVLDNFQPNSTRNSFNSCQNIPIDLFLFDQRPSWSWSYGSWICNYLCNQCLMVFNATQQYFSYIVAVSFIGGGNQRKPPTYHKSLTNFIT
jgi:hypothetical protein